MKRILLSIATTLLIFTGVEMFMPSISEAKRWNDPCDMLNCELIQTPTGVIIIDTENPEPKKPGFLQPVTPNDYIPF